RSRDHRRESKGEKNKSEVRASLGEKPCEQDVADPDPRKRREALDEDEERADRSCGYRTPERVIREGPGEPATGLGPGKDDDRGGVECRTEESRGSSHVRQHGAGRFGAASTAANGCGSPAVLVV